MAYDKHTWTCDEPITVERLNHIEDGIANAGGGGCGFECEEEIVTLTEESVTTELDGDTVVGELSYSQFIDADSITVTFDGVEYECPRIAAEYGNWYGGVDQSDPDFSEYPFVVLSLSSLGNDLYTETTGTHTIKIEVEDTIAKTTPCFDLARGYSCDAKQMVIEESVTTQGDDAIGVFSNASLIDAETIKVTFNGTEYECEQSKHSGVYIYGGFSTTLTPHPDSSQYLFVIASRPGNGNMLITETAGTYAVKIEWTKETITTTPCFEKAVEKCLPEAQTFDSAKASIPQKAIDVDFYNPAPGAENIASKSTRQIHFNDIDISRYGNNFIDAVVKSFQFQGVYSEALLVCGVSATHNMTNNTVSVSALVYNPDDNAVTLSTTASRVSIAVFYVNTTNVRDICYLEGNCTPPDPNLS